MKSSQKVELSDLNFQDFLQRGFIVQNPKNGSVFLGQIAEKNTLNQNNSHFSLFSSNFYHSNYAKIDLKNIVQLGVDDLLRWIKKNNPRNERLILKKKSDFDAEYAQDVGTCLDFIKKEKQITKLVAATYAEYEAGDFVHPIFTLEALNQLNGHLFGVWQNNQGFLGASPEPLFTKEGSELETVALAGTISTDVEDYAHKLQNDQKEQDEHKQVIQDITNKIQKIGSQVHVDKTTVYNFGPLAHLRTKIHFTSEKDVKLIVNEFAPTAALGGYPSELSLDYLKKLQYFLYEKESRNFGGTLVAHIEDMAFALVAIRNIYWEDNKFVIHSGSGIVSHSTVENECLEVKRKRESIERFFV